MAGEFLPIITSLHGRKFGLSRKGGLILNRSDGVKEGFFIDTANVTTAQVLALNATAISVLAAPSDTNYAWVVDRWAVHKPAGTAYAGIAGGEDLVLKYTNASGEQISAPIEATGFLDQATAQTRVGGGFGAASTTPASFTPINAAIVLNMLTGEIITGTSALKVRLWVRPLQIVFDTSIN